jgi:DNA ligase-1
LVACLQDGTEFKVSSGLSDALRRSPPALGTLFTFKYQELTDAGVPRFPSFLRVA